MDVVCEIKRKNVLILCYFSTLILLLYLETSIRFAPVFEILKLNHLQIKFPDVLFPFYTFIYSIISSQQVYQQLFSKLQNTSSLIQLAINPKRVLLNAGAIHN